jgi:hypothetical protein
MRSDKLESIETLRGSYTGRTDVNGGFFSPQAGQPIQRLYSQVDGVSSPTSEGAWHPHVEVPRYGHLYPQLPGYPNFIVVPSGIPVENNLDETSPSLRNRGRPTAATLHPNESLYSPSAPSLSQLTIQPPTARHETEDALNSQHVEEHHPAASCWQAPDGIGPMQKPRYARFADSLALAKPS